MVVVADVYDAVDAFAPVVDQHVRAAQLDRLGVQDDQPVQVVLSAVVSPDDVPGLEVEFSVDGYVLVSVPGEFGVDFMEALLNR